MHARVVVLLVQEVDIALPQMMNAGKKQSGWCIARGAEEHEGKPQLQVHNGEEEDGEDKHVESRTEIEHGQLTSSEVEEDVRGIHQHRDEEV